MIAYGFSNYVKFLYVYSIACGIVIYQNGQVAEKLLPDMPSYGRVVPPGQSACSTLLQIFNFIPKGVMNRMPKSPRCLPYH